MAPTSLELEAAPLVGPAQDESAEKSVRFVDRFAAKKHMKRYEELLEYLKRVVAKACPRYLASDQDDIVQTVLIRLDRKLDETVELIDCCRHRLQEEGHDSGPWVVEAIGKCLAQTEKAWDRDQTKKVKMPLRTVLAWARGEKRLSIADVLRKLDECLDRLRGMGGKEVYSKAYVYQGVHWAILDAKKRFVRLAEVSPEEREDGSWEWDKVPDRKVSGPHTIMIQEEISDCLRRLDEAKRRPTFLALLGYEYNEIAVFFDLSLPQADSRIRRGKAFLRRCLNLKGVSP